MTLLPPEATRRRRSGPAPPLYVVIPSVRPVILKTLSRWFFHALEARGKAGPKNWDFALRSAASAPVRQQLEKIRRWEARRPRSPAVPFDIHFVVVDNAGWYHGEPQAHSQQLNELARALNRLGNRLGVFVHHVPDAAIGSLFKESGAAEPFFHSEGGTPRLSIGGARNVGLAYVRALHRKRKPIQILPMDDDLYPRMDAGKNFFSPWKRSGEGAMGLVGWMMASLGRVPVRWGPSRSVHKLFKGVTGDLHYYPTGRGESGFSPFPQSGGRVLRGRILVHVGRTATYGSWEEENPPQFGRYLSSDVRWQGRDEVEPLPKRAAFQIKEDSGIHSRARGPKRALGHR